MTDILCTLGPSSLNEKVIKRLTDLNVSLFRINLSHTKIEDLPNVVETIRKYTEVPICFDTEGAQIRTCDLEVDYLELVDNSIIKVFRDKVPGNYQGINFHPLNIIDEIVLGDLISIDFNSVLTQVVEKDEKSITLKVLTGGRIGKNKAITMKRDVPLPCFSEKDVKAIELSKELGIKHLALSFAHKASDVAEMKRLAPHATIITKVECKSALVELDGIVSETDSILIDRGDMSRQVEIAKIPGLQKLIIEKAHNQNKKVYVATNLLETMITSPIPTRAEVNDIFSTLNAGADGLVLAAETAIGRYPERCVEMIVRLIHEHNNKKSSMDYYVNSSFSLLPLPHGGKLIKSVATKEEIDSSKELNRITLDITDVMDCELITNGTYSPLESFMNKTDLESVLDNYKLSSGVTWTLPITLQLNEEQYNEVKSEKSFVIRSETGNSEYLLEVEEFYECDMDSVAKRWFGTTSEDHPGVKKFKTKGNHFVAAKVKRLFSNEPYCENTYPPEVSRYIFEKKNWSRVVGFHTRNVIHRAHEFIQIKALQDVHADGLYLCPVVGPKKKGDFLSSVILKGYRKVIESGYFPDNSVLLGAFSTYSRYSGPREAVFTALCRKNMGCSHFIIGRDHTGVGNFYGKDENRNLFEKLGDIGISPIFFDEYAYNAQEDTFQSVEENNDLLKLSGTKIRGLLQESKSIPEWCMRSEVSEILINEIKKGNNIFHV
jgi:ATP sulfurylase